MLKIKERPGRRNRFLILDGESVIGIFQEHEEEKAKNRLKELQDAKPSDKKASFKKTPQNEK